MSSGTEVHAVGVYEEPVRTGNAVHGPEVCVRVDRSGANVTLLPGSYESVRWKPDVPSGTRIARIIVHGYGARSSEVWANGARHGDITFAELPLAHAPEGESFREMVAAVQGLTGQTGLTIFSGAYAAGVTPFIINGQSAQPPQLQPDYLRAQLVAADTIPDAFGPIIAGLAQANSQSQRVQPALRFTDEGFTDTTAGQLDKVLFPVTLDVPTISRPVAAARDTTSGKPYGVSLGGAVLI